MDTKPHLGLSEEKIAEYKKKLLEYLSKKGHEIAGEYKKSTDRQLIFSKLSESDIKYEGAFVGGRVRRRLELFEQHNMADEDSDKRQRNTYFFSLPEYQIVFELCNLGYRDSVSIDNLKPADFKPRLAAYFMSNKTTCRPLPDMFLPIREVSEQGILNCAKELSLSDYGIDLDIIPRKRYSYTFEDILDSFISLKIDKNNPGKKIVRILYNRTQT